MSINLMHASDTARTDAAAIWSQVTQYTDKHGILEIDSDTVNAIARLLENAPLANGQSVTAYALDDDFYEPMVCSFGPSLLSCELQDAVRNRLDNTKNGKAAVRLFNLILRLGIQVGFSGADHCFARMVAVNGPADEVEISRTSVNMYEMLRQLGIAYDSESDYGEVDFETFRKAVQDNGWRVDMAQRLDDFVACAQRNEATRVFWA